jgi:hypothetical protein
MDKSPPPKSLKNAVVRGIHKGFQKGLKNVPRQLFSSIGSPSSNYSKPTPFKSLAVEDEDISELLQQNQEAAYDRRKNLYHGRSPFAVDTIGPNAHNALRNKISSMRIFSSPENSDRLSRTSSTTSSRTSSIPSTPTVFHTKVPHETFLSRPVPRYPVKENVPYMKGGKQTRKKKKSVKRKRKSRKI